MVSIVGRISGGGESHCASHAFTSHTHPHGGGRSVHNTRIERLWYDVTRGYGSVWKAFFLELEQDWGLDPERTPHLWLLHHLFHAELNADALEWAEAWNAHRLHVTGERAASPRERFMFGMIRHGPRGIEHLIEPADEDLEDREVAGYGIDWDVVDDPVLMAHHAAHEPMPTDSETEGRMFGFATGPQQLSEVTCDPPLCPLTTEQVCLLNAHLTLHCGSLDTSSPMEARRTIWVVALQFCVGMF